MMDVKSTIVLLSLFLGNLFSFYSLTSRLKLSEGKHFHSLFDQMKNRKKFHLAVVSGFSGRNVGAENFRLVFHHSHACIYVFLYAFRPFIKTFRNFVSVFCSTLRFYRFLLLVFPLCSALNSTRVFSCCFFKLSNCEPNFCWWVSWGFFLLPLSEIKASTWNSFWT